MPAANNTALRAVTLNHPINKNITLDLVTITPSLASEWLGSNHNNRNQRGRKIVSYGRDMLNGEWLTTGESIKFDWNGHLIDGQHRLEAVAQTGITIVSIVVRGLDPRVQRVLDTNVRRSAADALEFAGVKLSAKDIASCARVGIAYESGMLTTALDNVKVDVTNAEQIAWHDANPDIANAVALAQKVARPMGATVAGIGYAALVLERIDAADAIEFFLSAAELRTDGKGDPRKAMLDAFKMIRDSRRAPTAAESLAIVFRAWNMWRAGSKLQIIRSGASDGAGGITGVTILKPI